MKIPLISSDHSLNVLILTAIEEIRLSYQVTSRKIQFIPILTAAEGIEYINYQMPSLMVINFSDQGFSPWDVMDQIVADPWLNNGAIIAIYSDHETYEKINALENTNIIIAVDREEINQYFIRTLKIVLSHHQFLFQRSMQTTFVGRMNGQFTIDMDVGLVPCYANLVTNYLYNVGLLGLEEKHQVNLCLVEMLTNAIEHGNCGITAEEKTEFLSQDFNIKKLIDQKCIENPEISKKKVYFKYGIERSGSTFTITDEGEGFDWREVIKEGREIDYMATHGRGIILTKMNVQEISYNDKGNEVRLYIEHLTPKAAALPAGFINNEILEFEPGDVVCHQGEDTSVLYYIAEGEYDIEIDGQVIAMLTPYDMLIGEMAFLLQEKRSATVRASTKGRLIKISKEDFVNTIKEFPYYGVFLSKLLAERLQRASHKLTN